jgi:Rieske Fe-S protein
VEAADHLHCPCHLSAFSSLNRWPTSVGTAVDLRRLTHSEHSKPLSMERAGYVVGPILGCASSDSRQGSPPSLS